MPVFTIEGGIGAGKTTFLKSISEAKFCKSHCVVFEPIDKWTNVDTFSQPYNLNMLEMFYNNKAKYAFMFQMLTLQTRITTLIDAVKNNPEKIIFCERSYISDAIFANMLYSNLKLITEEEYTVYNHWWHLAQETINNTCDVIGSIYIKTSPHVCVDRMIHRDRSCERQINIDYMHHLHLLHEEWYNKTTLSTYVVNGDVESKDINISSIVSFVNTLTTAQ